MVLSSHLRDDGVETVLHRVLAPGACPYDALWFAGNPLPAVEELAAQYEDADGQRIHFTSESMRFRWLD